MIDVPSGTVTSTPSISSVTNFVPVPSGVPPSTWSTECIKALSANRLQEVLVKVFQGTPNGERRHASQPAQRPIYHGIAQLRKEIEVLVTGRAITNSVDDLDAPCGANPAGRAFSARFVGTEFHCEASHFRA